MEHNKCCESMKIQIEQTLNNKDSYLSVDNLIYYSDIFNEYGLIIHDGGESYLKIDYCPWCGTKLPNSERDNWFDLLESLGYDSPLEQEIPQKFKSSEWRLN